MMRLSYLILLLNSISVIGDDSIKSVDPIIIEDTGILISSKFIDVSNDTAITDIGDNDTDIGDNDTDINSPEGTDNSIITQNDGTIVQLVPNSTKSDETPTTCGQCDHAKVACVICKYAPICVICYAAAISVISFVAVVGIISCNCVTVGCGVATIKQNSD